MGSNSVPEGSLATTLKNPEAESHLAWRKCDIDFDTIAVTATMDPGTFTKTCFMPPIITSTVFNTSLEGRLEGASPLLKPLHFYSRFSNPTRLHLETVLAKLEGANYAITFSSGMAAIAAIFQCCAKGDHVICVQAISGDTDWLLKNKLGAFGIDCDEIFSQDADKITEKINSRTKLIFMECPNNPLLQVTDIEATSTKAKQINPDVKVVVDSTILTPIFQRPLMLGADVVIHSLTKYFAGHADIAMGSILCNSKELYEMYQNCQIFLGATPSPTDCYMMIRSLKTLPLRMRQHFKSGMAVAQYLENHPMVDRVYFPGLKSDPGHELALKQQTGMSGLMSFYLKGDFQDTVNFINALNLFKHAGSFASDVSMVVLPSITSQRQMSKEDRFTLGIEPKLVRISVGLEGVQAIIQDLEKAFQAAFDGQGLKA